LCITAPFVFARVVWDFQGGLCQGKIWEGVKGDRYLLVKKETEPCGALARMKNTFAVLATAKVQKMNLDECWRNICARLLL